MGKQFGAVLLLIFFGNVFAHSQPRQIDMAKRRNIEWRSMKDGQGNNIGCDLSFECRGFQVVFIMAEFDKHTQEMHVEGFVFDPRLLPRDSVGIPAVEVILATPKNNLLHTMTKLGFTKVIEPEIEGAKRSLRNGYFNLTFHIKRNQRLYFAHPRLRLEEYNLKKIK